MATGELGLALGTYGCEVRAILIEEDKPALTEPVIVPATFVTGTAVSATDTYVQIVGWDQLPVIEGEPAERRIVLRLVLPPAAARMLVSQLRKAVEKGGH